MGGHYGSAIGTVDYEERLACFTEGNTFGGSNGTVSRSNFHTYPLYQRDRSFSNPLPFIPGRIKVLTGTIGGATPASILTANLSAPGGSRGTASFRLWVVIAKMHCG